LGVLWLAAAALAPFFRGGRVRWLAGVWVVIAGLALIGGDCLQGVGCPGFRTFHIHARIWTVAALPTAFLTGVTTDVLFEGAVAPELRLRFLAVACLALTVGVAARLFEAVLEIPPGEEVRAPWYKAALTVLLPTTIIVLVLRLRSGAAAGRLTRLAWLGLLLTDLWAAAWPLAAVKSVRELYPPPRCVAALLCERERDQATKPWRVVDCGASVAGRSTDVCPHGPLGAGCPLALVHGLQAVGGFSPLDVHRFRNYLQFVEDDPTEVVPLALHNGQPVLVGTPVHNKKLIDLLGVRFLLQPSDPSLAPEGHVAAAPPGWRRVPAADDRAPRAYDFVAGGFPDLPPYEVWENTAVFPRAFVVPRAAPTPGQQTALAALKDADLHETVLLEDWRDEFAARPAVGGFRAAEIIDYRPNRVAIHTEGPAGWLVLADVWFPGWTCTVNGAPVEIRRADYLFRAVEVPDGPCEVVFTFAPESCRRGREISVLAAAMLAILAAGYGLFAARRRRRGALGGRP
jgi:hypothetical protein